MKQISWHERQTANEEIRMRSEAATTSFGLNYFYAVDHDLYNKSMAKGN
jgi:hypothetical protein